MPTSVNEEELGDDQLQGQGMRQFKWKGSVLV